MIAHRTRLGIRALLTMGLALIAFSASAQRTTGRTDPENIERTRKHSESVAEALSLVVKARDAMRLRKFDRVAELGDRAANDLFLLGGNEYATEAHEVLAEAAVLQGQWIEALRQADACEPRLVVQRFAMTKALALMGVGRLVEARTLVLNEIGTPEKPGFFRQAQHISKFPIDADQSEAALKSTVYLIRSAWLYSVEGYPEAMDDIQAASMLAPNHSVVRFRLARALHQSKKYASARVEYAKAATMGDKEVNERVRKALTDLEKENAASAKPNETSPKIDD